MGIKNINSLLFDEHSKKQTLRIVDLVICEKETLDDIFNIIHKNQPIYSQRAAWVISTLADTDISLLNPFVPELINCLNSKFHDAVLRASFKALSKINIPEKFQGKLFETGIVLLNKKSTATGVKTWIIDLLMNIATEFPDLQQEIKTILKLQVISCDIGIRGKMSKTIQKIDLNSLT